MMLLACTNMLYNADATVLVLTEPALRDVIATLMACAYGASTNSVAKAYLTHRLVLDGMNSDATSKGRHHI